MSGASVPSAVFRNLAKASEKQQLYVDSALFGQLAELNTKEKSNTDDLDSVRAELAGDIETAYPRVVDAGTESGDRGVLRAAKWGEKVTKTQKALLDRYATKGEDLLVGKDLYVCEACGFIFLGTEMPEVCPVCKAPRSRFSVVK